jgi:tetratricopeptide (TPR) repeat protein
LNIRFKYCIENKEFVKIYILTDIRRRQLGITLAIMLLTLFSLNNVCAQTSQPVTTRQSSMEAFSKGNYEQAFKGFSELLQKYPKDPLYKYYSGACLVMMRQDPDEAVVLLQQSLNGASVVRSLPPDALFYLGRAQQMSGKFTEAIASFASYSDQVGKKKARDQGVPGFIQECENNKGIVAAAAAKPAVSSVNGNTEISKQPDQPVRDDTEKKPAGQEIMAREQLPPEYEKLLDEALKMQYKADSLTLLAGEQERQLDGLSEAEKVSHKMKISQNEILAASYQKSADMKYNEAQLKMNPGQVTGPQKEDTATQAVSKEPVVTEENKNISEDEGKNVVKDQEITAALKSAEVY